MDVPTREICAQYVKAEKEGRRIGRWVDTSGKLCSTEQIASKWYNTLGYEAKTCKGVLIRTWVGAFLAPIIQDPKDTHLVCGMRHPTRGWSTANRDTPIVFVRHPDDFGSKEYYERRSKEFNDWFEELESKNLVELLEKLLDKSAALRDYLWVNEDYAVELARTALHVVPSKIVLAFIRWAVQDYWNRQVGWPTLFVYNYEKFLFVKVKSQDAKLSAKEINWFRWATEEVQIPCEICKIKERRNSR